MQLQINLHTLKYKLAGGIKVKTVCGWMSICVVCVCLRAQMCMYV